MRTSNQTPGKVTSSPHAPAGRAWYLAALLILLTLLIGNWDLVSGKAAPQWDAADYFAPAFSIIADHIRSARLLLWDPWIGAGNPDFAEPELGTTSPIVLLLGLISPNPQFGFVSYWLLSWYLGGLGMLLFARSLGTPVWGATIVSLAFISSGLYTGHAEHTSSIYSTSFLPWIFWRFNLALSERRYWFAVQAGTLYGLSALGGYPEFTILTPMLLGLWALGHVLFLRVRLVQLAAVLVITSLVGVSILLPGYAGIIKATRGFSDRIGPRPRSEAISSNPLPAGALNTFASPYLALLNFPPNAIWPQTDISMTSIYVGPIILIFFLLACLGRPRAWRWWLISITLLFLACCLGDQLPVRGWIYDLVWPTRYFRNPALFRAYVIFLAATMASLGIKDLVQAEPQGSRRALLSAATFVVVCASVVAFSSVVNSTSKVLEDQYPFAMAQLALTSFGIVAGVLLFQFEFVDARTWGVLLLAIGVVDSVATLHMSKPTMYAEGMSRYFHAANTNHKLSLNLGEAGLNRQLNPPAVIGITPNNRNIPLRVAELNGYLPLANRFEEQIAADPALRAMAIGRDRFWFTSSPTYLPPTNSNFGLFKQKVDSIGQPVLVLHSVGEMLSLGSRNLPDQPDSATAHGLANQAICTPAAISNISYGPNALAFSYRAGNPGWLMVTDRWAPDWRVTVNGAEQQVLGANFIFRAIKVAAGDNLVRFRYHPTYFILLAVLSWTVLLFVLVSELTRFSFTRN